MIHLSIGGLVIALEADGAFPLEVTGATRRFVVEEPAAIDCRIRARWGAVEPAPGPPRFDSGGVWKVYDEGDGLRFDFHSATFGTIPYKSARFDAGFQRGEVTFHSPYFQPDQPLYPLEYPLDEILATQLLGRTGGIELHAAGIVDTDGEGWLFAAQSGGGKTTMSRLWLAAGGAVLSDDRIIVRESGGSIRMFGTPWHGEAELSVASSAPLRGIFLLHHGSENRCVRVVAPTSLAELLTRAFPPLWDRSSVDAALAFLDRLTEAVPVLDLWFHPDQETVAFLRECSAEVSRR
ncbi:MAG TPA: hypothetical protein VM534_05405 [Thermoanaerobaculia bacterium]|nr:hypothetical protein [Thermoanaerobaculia bacterium]